MLIIASNTGNILLELIYFWKLFLHLLCTVYSTPYLKVLSPTMIEQVVTQKNWDPRNMMLAIFSTRAGSHMVAASHCGKLPLKVLLGSWRGRISCLSRAIFLTQNDIWGHYWADYCMPNRANNTSWCRFRSGKWYGGKSPSPQCHYPNESWGPKTLLKGVFRGVWQIVYGCQPLWRTHDQHHG